MHSVSLTRLVALAAVAAVIYIGFLRKAVFPHREEAAPSVDAYLQYDEGENLPAL